MKDKEYWQEQIPGRLRGVFICETSREMLSRSLTAGRIKIGCLVKADIRVHNAAVYPQGQKWVPAASLYNAYLHLQQQTKG